MSGFARGGSIGLITPEHGTTSPYPGSAWPPKAISEPSQGVLPERVLRLKGDFTPLRFVIDLSTPILERALGLPVGRLRQGFRIVAMADGQDLRPGDIQIDLLERSAGVGFDVDSHARLVRLEHGQAGTDGPVRGRDRIEAIERKLIAALFREAGNAPAMVLPNPTSDLSRHLPVPRLRFSVPQYTLLSARNFVVVKTMM